MNGIADIRAALAPWGFAFSSERELQDGIEDALARARIPFQREVRLAPGDVVDFMVGGIAVEVKTSCGLSEVTRQLHRYAQHEAVSALLLVTSQPRLGNLPASMNGKPVETLALLGGIL